MRGRHALALAMLGGWKAAALAEAVAPDAPAIAAVHFDNDFLMNRKGERIDVSRFARGSPVPPGDYRLDLYLNGNWLGNTSVRFAAAPADHSAAPCFAPSLIERLGLDAAALDAAGRDELARMRGGECGNFARIAAAASYAFDLGKLRLDLSLPQAALLRNPRGYVSPEFWDAGILSATLGYNFSAFRMSGSGGASTSSYLGLNGGLNAGGWHLRHHGSASLQSRGRGTYQSVATYLQRDLPALRSQLTLGDVFTDGAMFDSLGIRGATLASDERMLPESVRGYAPLIRGVANSNAHVKVTQNGNTLYEINVAPGEFRIDDLNPTGYGGDLLVTITEADGSQRSFGVPYAAVAQSLRPGTSRFNVSAGRLRERLVGRRATIVQATAQHGFTNLFTGYAGVLAANGYMAGLLGAAFNTLAGAVALDVTQARASIARAGRASGQSVRLSYSQLLEQTGTGITVAAYRYSSSGYRSVRDALGARESRGGRGGGQDPALAYRQRNQLQLTLNQNLGVRWGNLYAVGSTTDYWRQRGTMTQFQIGYNGHFRVGGLDLSVNLSLSRQRDGFSGRLENQVFASVSLPLGRGRPAPLLTGSYGHSNNGGGSQQVSLGGGLGEDSALNYNVSAGRAAGNGNGGASMQYRGAVATLSAGVAGGRGYTQQSLGISGAVVAHAGGVTLSNALGETVAVVEARGAEGARVNGISGLRIDARGYAVVPYLTPYAVNTVSIDPKGTPLDIELRTTSERVAPRANAVVKVRFATVSGRAVLIRARLPDGTALPFGADVLDEQGNRVGIAGHGGRLFARGLPEAGRLSATWGARPGERCTFAYRLPAAGGNAHASLAAVCDSGDVPLALAPASDSRTLFPIPDESGAPAGANFP